jgi:hypothetical protein
MDGVPHSPARPPILNRTCQGCRQRKIRCVFTLEQANTGNRQCDRCRKLSLVCLFLPPKKSCKPRRRHNDAQIRELERKVEALQNPRTPTVASSLPASEGESSSAASQSLDSKFPMSENFARELYNSFYEHLAPVYPIVRVPSPASWQTVQAETPVLFQAAITAGCSRIDPDLSDRLFVATGKILAEKVLMMGEKSLELVQALLIMSVWHQPPKQFQALRFNQYATMAAAMMTDLQWQLEEIHGTPADLIRSYSIPDDALAWNRTYLACYFLCSR